jgi:hypothetical protein
MTGWFRTATMALTGASAGVVYPILCLARVPVKIAKPGTKFLVQGRNIAKWVGVVIST